MAIEQLGKVAGSLDCWGVTALSIERGSITPSPLAYPRWRLGSGHDRGSAFTDRTPLSKLRRAKKEHDRCGGASQQSGRASNISNRFSERSLKTSRCGRTCCSMPPGCWERCCLVV